MGAVVIEEYFPSYRSATRYKCFLVYSDHSATAPVCIHRPVACGVRYLVKYNGNITRVSLAELILCTQQDVRLKEMLIGWQCILNLLLYIFKNYS